MRQKPGVIDKDSEEDEVYDRQEQAFTFLVEHLLGHVIGKREWDMQKCFHMVSDRVSISDEAYTLLLLENVYEKWLKLKPQQPGEKQTIVKGRYTDPEKGASNEKYKGWTVDGIERYNELYNSVERNRNQKWAKAVEKKAKDEFQGRYKGKLIGTQIRRKKRRQQGDWDLDNNDEANKRKEYPAAMNELGKMMQEVEDKDSSDAENSTES
jgi:hypothetical protein